MHLDVHGGPSVYAQLAEAAPPRVPPPMASKIQSVGDYLSQHKICFHKVQEHAGDAPEPESVPLVSEAPRFMWTLQRWLLVKKSKGGGNPVLPL